MHALSPRRHKPFIAANVALRAVGEGHISSIVFRTGPGSKLAAATSTQVLAFEVDEVDAGWQTGWSVLLRGRATEIDDAEEIRKLVNLGLRPWSAGGKDHWVRLRATRISGRHLT